MMPCRSADCTHSPSHTSSRLRMGPALENKACTASCGLDSTVGEAPGLQDAAALQKMTQAAQVQQPALQTTHLYLVDLCLLLIIQVLGALNVGGDVMGGSSLTLVSNKRGGWLRGRGFLGQLSRRVKWCSWQRLVFTARASTHSAGQGQLYVLHMRQAHIPAENAPV